jgi:PucR family transcriptional regulator, purine catabolism regulatory protein
MSLSVRQLLALGQLPNYRVVAGSSGLNTSVHSVVAGSTIRALSDIARGGLVVFTGSQLPLDDSSADLAIRYGASVGIAGLITSPPPHPIALSTMRLADKFQLPLIVTSPLDQAALVTSLGSDVRAPEIAGAQRVAAVLRRLTPSSSDAATVMGVLRSELRTPLAILDAEGRPVDGDREPNWRHLLSTSVEVLGASHPTPRVLDTDCGDQIVLHPVLLPPSQRAGLWFAALVQTDLAAVLEPVRQCLTIGAWGFTTHLATRSLITEVQGRQRALLLAEILENPDSLTRQTVERAMVLGWRLSGWHTVVHVTSAVKPPPATHTGLSSDLEAALSDAGLPASIVERPDGWAFWVTDEVASDKAGQDLLAKKLRTALLSVESEHDGLRLSAGLGLPAQGATGLASSLRDACKASMLARSRESNAAVERTDTVGLRRMLHVWYSYTPARDLAAEVLQPLRDCDPGGQLIRTLACFLDHESSIATTAAVLGVHRNTVLHRMAKIREALGVDLSDPNDRLAAHLATRADQLPVTDGQLDQTKSSRRWEAV